MTIIACVYRIGDIQLCRQLHGAILVVFLLCPDVCAQYYVEICSSNVVLYVYIYLSRSFYYYYLQCASTSCVGHLFTCHFGVHNYVGSNKMTSCDFT